MKWISLFKGARNGSDRAEGLLRHAEGVLKKSAATAKKTENAAQKIRARYSPTAEGKVKEDAFHSLCRLADEYRRLQRELAEERIALSAVPADEEATNKQIDSCAELGERLTAAFDGYTDAYNALRSEAKDIALALRLHRPTARVQAKRGEQAFRRIRQSTQLPEQESPSTSSRKAPPAAAPSAEASATTGKCRPKPLLSKEEALKRLRELTLYCRRARNLATLYMRAAPDTEAGRLACHLYREASASLFEYYKNYHLDYGARDEEAQTETCSRILTRKSGDNALPSPADSALLSLQCIAASCAYLHLRSADGTETPAGFALITKKEEYTVPCRDNAVANRLRLQFATVEAALPDEGEKWRVTVNLADSEERECEVLRIAENTACGLAGPDVLFAAEDSHSPWESPLFPLIPELAPALPADGCVYCCGLAGRLLQEYEVTDSTEDAVTANAGSADRRLTAQFYVTEDTEAPSLPAGAPVTDAFGRVLALVNQFAEGDMLASVPLYGLQEAL